MASKGFLQVVHAELQKPSSRSRFLPAEPQVNTALRTKAEIHGTCQLPISPKSPAA